MEEFVISYDGYSADQHQIDMRRLGYALVGLDHIVSAGLIGLTQGRFPKGRERIDLTIIAEPPKEGSVEIVGGFMAAYEALQPAFPFLLDTLKSKGTDVVWNWLSASFKWLGGRKEEAEPHIDKLIDFMKGSHEGTLNDRANEREFILELIESLRPNAANVARPVGSSSRRLLIKDESVPEPTEIDSAMAAAIRSKENLKVSDLKEIDIRIDGITKHSNRATIEFAHEPNKFYYADIKDPIVNVQGNAYIRALDSGQPISVIARITYKGDEIHRVFVLAEKRDGDPFETAA